MAHPVLTSLRIRAVAAVAGGGLVGSAARTAVGLIIPAMAGGFPVSVVVVNVLGSFLLGLFLARRERATGGATSLQFWGIGVLGSFTTFSAFSTDVVELLAAGRVLACVGYVSMSLLGGLALARVGRRIGGVVR